MGSFHQELPTGLTKTLAGLHPSLRQSLPILLPPTFILTKVTNNTPLAYLILSQCLPENPNDASYIHFFKFESISISCYYLYEYLLYPPTQTFDTERKLSDGRTTKSLKIKRLEEISGPATHGPWS